MSRWRWLIVGAGFTGAVLAERIANELDQSVLVVDRRDHIGGNAFDYSENGLLVHRYGPHIFHTSSQRIWTYLSRFTEWRPYFHRVLGVIDGQHVPVPFNLNSILALFPPRMADRFCDALVQRYGFGQKVPILKLRKEEDEDLQFLANYVYTQSLRRLHAEAMGHASWRNSEPFECHGEGAHPDQSRRPVFSRLLPGNATRRVHRAVQPLAPASKDQRRVRNSL